MRKHLPKNNLGQFMKTSEIGDMAEKLSLEFFAKFPDVDLDDLISIFLSKMLWAKTMTMLEEVHTNGLSDEDINNERSERLEEPESTI